MSKKTIIALAAIALAAGSVVFLAARTSGPPPESETAEEPDPTGRRGLVPRELTENESAEISGWREQGVLLETDRFTHEAVVDSDGWDELSDDEKERLIVLVSLYFKQFDGTNQAKLLRSGNGTIAGDYFGDVIRLR
jgi:hypothetical protein